MNLFEMVLYGSFSKEYIKSWERFSWLETPRMTRCTDTGELKEEKKESASAVKWQLRVSFSWEPLSSFFEPT